MNDSLSKLYDVVVSRRSENTPGSYTCYLFEQGLDKILKKCGEECSEVIIASKNGDNEATSGEICDLLYHLTVLMAELDIPLSKIYDILDERSLKIGNLKKFHQTDRNS